MYVSEGDGCHKRCIDFISLIFLCSTSLILQHIWKSTNFFPRYQLPLLSMFSTGTAHYLGLMSEADNNLSQTADRRIVAELIKIDSHVVSCKGLLRASFATSLSVSWCCTTWLRWESLPKNTNYEPEWNCAHCVAVQCMKGI